MRRSDDDNAMNDKSERRLQSSAEGPSALESRSGRLKRIRGEIARGEYDTPERFEAACDRMFESLVSWR